MSKEQLDIVSRNMLENENMQWLTKGLDLSGSSAGT